MFIPQSKLEQLNYLFGLVYRSFIFEIWMFPELRLFFDGCYSCTSCTVLTVVEPLFLLRPHPERSLHIHT